MNKENKNVVNEDKEIKNTEIENLENSEKKTDNKSKFSISFFNWKYIYYIIVLFLSLALRYNLDKIEVVLGDFGSIIPMLLNIVSYTGLKWVPIFCIVGLLLVVFEEKYKEFSKIYIIITGFITVVSILIQFIM